MILGITGTDGAGKGTVVDYLVKEKGFVHYSSRNWFLEIIVEKGMEPTRANMRSVANALRKQRGNDCVVQEYLKRAHEAGHENFIIESIRATAEAEAIKKNGGVLLAVDADVHIRYERIMSRASSSDKVSFEEFIEHEELEKNDPDPNGMQKAKVMEMADHTIDNDGTLEELAFEIEKFYSTFA